MVNGLLICVGLDGMLSKSTENERKIKRCTKKCIRIGLRKLTATYVPLQPRQEKGFDESQNQLKKNEKLRKEKVQRNPYWSRMIKKTQKQIFSPVANTSMAQQTPNSFAKSQIRKHQNLPFRNFLRRKLDSCDACSTYATHAHSLDCPFSSATSICEKSTTMQLSQRDDHHISHRDSNVDRVPRLRHSPVALSKRTQSVHGVDVKVMHGKTVRGAFGT